MFFSEKIQPNQTHEQTQPKTNCETARPRARGGLDKFGLGLSPPLSSLRPFQSSTVSVTKGADGRWSPI